MAQHILSRRESDDGDIVLTKSVKAGRRTYFLDVRATRGGDYYLTVTESRKTTFEDGRVSYDRHKIFLYKEDFAKFTDALNEVVEYIHQKRPEEREQEK